MDNKTKEFALEKVNSINPLISYPHELLDDEKLKANVTIHEIILFESILALNKFNKREDFKNLHNYVSKTRWEDRSFIAIINAFYSPLDNNKSIKENTEKFKRKL
jgi:putative endopeptidase